MNKINLFCLLLVFVSCKSYDFNSFSKEKQAVIQSCTVCHSADAKVNRAPLLEGMEDWYILEQLANFKEGKRGSTEADKLMSVVASSLTAESSEEVAAYFASLEKKSEKSNLSGDIKVGENLYAENCKGCHSKAIGRFFTGSPLMEHLNGDYILKQLKDFRDDKRSFVEVNKHKEKMIVVAKRFNDQQFNDIVAYIESQK